MTIRALSLLALLATILGGCASTDTRYPSLAVRDVERAEGEFEPVETPPISVPPVETGLTGALEPRLAALVAQTQEAHRDFTAAVPTTTRLASAASGSAIGSDAWASAQVALADLDSARSQAAIALGDLDILFIAASVEGAERTAIVAARDQVIALVAEEDAVLERLRAQVR